MNQRKKNHFNLLVLAMLLTIASAPQLTLLRPVNAQGPINLRALGIDNEARQIVSLTETHVGFFKRAAEQRKKGGLTPREAQALKGEGDQRKADLATLQRQFESLVNKLKQGNHFDEAFDAQALAALKSDSDRSLLTAAGGARKLFEKAIREVNLLRDEIDEEVRGVTSKQQETIRDRNNRAFAAHARPPVGKLGCDVLFASYVTAVWAGIIKGLTCKIAQRYNEKGCTPKINGCD